MLQSKHITFIFLASFVMFTQTMNITDINSDNTTTRKNFFGIKTTHKKRFNAHSMIAYSKQELTLFHLIYCGATASIESFQLGKDAEGILKYAFDDLTSEGNISHITVKSPDEKILEFCNQNNIPIIDDTNNIILDVSKYRLIES